MGGWLFYEADLWNVISYSTLTVFILWAFSVISLTVAAVSLWCYRRFKPLTDPEDRASLLVVQHKRGSSKHVVPDSHEASESESLHSAPSRDAPEGHEDSATSEPESVQFSEWARSDDHYTKFWRYFLAYNILSVGAMVALIIAHLCYYSVTFNPLKEYEIRPYLTFGGVDAFTTMRVNWRSSRMDGCAGQFLFCAEECVGAPPERWTIFPIFSSNGMANYLYVELTDLVPGHTYYYRIPGLMGGNETYSFTQPSAHGSPGGSPSPSLTIGVFTDMHAHAGTSKVLRQRLADKRPDLLVFCGDMVTFGAAENSWLLAFYSKGIFGLAHTCPIIAASGNHEAYQTYTKHAPRRLYSTIFGNREVQDRALRYPMDPETTAAVYPEDALYPLEDMDARVRPYYEDAGIPPFDRGQYFHHVLGNTAIIVLDCWEDAHRTKKHRKDTGAFVHRAQLRWLFDTLESLPDTVEYTFLVYHVPLYSIGTKLSPRELAITLEPIICKYGITAVLSGHRHMFEMWNVTDACKDYSATEGVQHTFAQFVAGSVGGLPELVMGPLLGQRKWPAPSFQGPVEPERFSDVFRYDTHVMSETNFHYMVIRISQGSCTVDVHRLRDDALVAFYELK